MLSTQPEKADSLNSPQRYECQLAILPDEEGGYSAVVVNLPGVGSCGETEAEAIEGACEALVGVIQSFRDRGLEIPWSDATNSELTSTSSTKWVTVDA